jgi:ankyrin repeat protein
MNGYSLLHYACSRGHINIAAALLRVADDINVKTDEGESPLHLAVFSGNLLAVEQLLDHGVDINSRNSYGETALFYAARKGYTAVIRLLLQRGADSSIRDELDETARDHVKDEHVLKAFDYCKVIDGNSMAGRLSHGMLLEIFKYLNVKELCRSACVSGKWHRVSEHEILWSALGIKRWECALQSSLGFSLTAMSTFSIRKSTSFKKSKPLSR